MATHSLIRLLGTVVPEEDIFMYADDLAVVVRDISLARDLCTIFGVIEKISSLRLNVTKCKIVPLRAHIGSWISVVAEYTGALAAAAPQWQSMQVVTSATYLGFVVGPTASLSNQWREPVAKFARRVQEITSGRESPSLAAAQLNSYAGPTLQYVAQLAPTTEEVQAAVRVSTQRVLRFPYRALPHGMEHRIHECGGPRISDVIGHAEATRQRAALRIEGVAARARERLERARREWGPLAALGDRAESAESRWWVALAWVDLVREAAETARAHIAYGTDDAEMLGGRACERALTREVLRARSMVPVGRLLLARARKWVPLELASDDALVERLEAAAAERRGSPPCHGVARLRTLCNAWNSSWRRGLGRRSCAFCGRLARDTAPHIWVCTVLWSAASSMVGAPPPQSVFDMLGLVRSPRAPGRGRRAYERPPLSALMMTIGSDIYQNTAEASQRAPRTRRVSGPVLRATARHALRRIWPL